MLSYSDKRKQLLKITFLINEQNVSVIMYIGINAILWCLDFNIFQQDECFCSKLGMEVEYAKSNLKTSLAQIWVSCDLLPFVRVGQHSSGLDLGGNSKESSWRMSWNCPREGVTSIGDCTISVRITLRKAPSTRIKGRPKDTLNGWHTPSFTS